MPPNLILLSIVSTVCLIFLLGGGMGLLMVRLLRRPMRPGSTVERGFQDGLFYGAQFLKYLLAAHIVGAIGGVLYYLAISPLLGETATPGFILQKGMANGVFFLGWVWGPGIALVGCFIRARREWTEVGKPVPETVEASRR